MDHDDMSDDDEFDFDRIRDAIGDYFANKPPRDRVPAAPLSRAELEALGAAVGTRTPTRQAGKLSADAVTASTEFADEIAAVVVPRHLIGDTAIPGVTAYDDDE